MIYKIRAYKPDEHSITVDFIHSNRKKKDRIVDFKEMCKRVLTMLMETGVSSAPVFYLRTDQPIEDVKQQLDDAIQRFFVYLEDWLKEQEREKMVKDTTDKVVTKYKGALDDLATR